VVGQRVLVTCAFAIAVAAAATAIGPSRAQSPACAPPPLLVRNVTQWTSSALVRGRDVLVRDGRIAAIEPAGRLRPGDVTTIDGTGHTLLPGFVDAHLHLTIPGGLPPADRSAHELTRIAGQQLLRSGVTSGRLHLATLEEAVRLKAQSADPCAPQPRLQVGGPGLSGAADRDFGNFQGVKSVEDARSKIDRFRAAGIDWVAIHDADKIAPPLREALRAAVREAGLRIMASGNTPDEIAAALSLRPDTLDYFDRSASERYADDLLAAIRAQKDLVLVPTPGVPSRTIAYRDNAGLVEAPSNFEFLSPGDRDFVLSTARKDLGGAEPARSARVLQSLPAKFAQLRQLGLTMAMGSDAGSTLHFPAGAIWWELEAWRSLGATHREALTAATEHGARVLRTGETGRLTVGARADFILYQGDVEQGPFALARVLEVAKDGVRFVAGGRWMAN
jgi:imidazolonepropionase-like amidohydrolase